MMHPKKLELMEEYVSWSNQAQHPDFIWTNEHVERGLSLCNELYQVTTGILQGVVKSRHTQLLRMKESASKVG